MLHYHFSPLMKNIKPVLLGCLLTVIAFVSVVYTSCSKKDPCDGLNCINGGACNFGRCVCPVGFEGTYCEVSSDPCKKITCLNGGSCTAGKCACPTGYYGTYCETYDPCRTVSCTNGGYCINGSCLCPDGYEGTYCETISRAKFIKVWNATDKDVPATSSVYNYSTTISAGTGPVTSVIVSKIWDGFFTAPVTASVVRDTITIPLQDPDNDGYTITGHGIYDRSAAKISWNYTIKSSASVIRNFSGTWE